MISPERFYQHLLAQGIDFFVGVPDSLMKDFLLYLQEHVEEKKHVIAANEGLAVALATGYHLSTGRLPLVYLQNSGLGNAVNPLTSLTDKEIYGVPMLLLIGWRGKPGRQDEPQHKKMGRITAQLLDLLEIPFFTLDKEETNCFDAVNKAIITTMELQQPVALLLPGDLFEPSIVTTSVERYPLSREQVLEELYKHFTGNETVVCTTGKTGREFYELNEHKSRSVRKEFLCVGAMGLANHVALGIDLQQKERVIMLDGDGALLMHLGALTATGKLAGRSFIHILFNNGCHESVGGQPTVGLEVDLCAMAKAAGYERNFCIDTKEALVNWLQNEFTSSSGKQFVEVRINASSRRDLGRPQGSPRDWKEALMKELNH